MVLFRHVQVATHDLMKPQSHIISCERYNAPKPPVDNKSKPKQTWHAGFGEHASNGTVQGLEWVLWGLALICQSMVRLLLEDHHLDYLGDQIILLMDKIPNNHLGCVRFPVNKFFLPTSTGEFTGFLNHQQVGRMMPHQLPPLKVCWTLEAALVVDRRRSLLPWSEWMRGFHKRPSVKRSNET